MQSDDNSAGIGHNGASDETKRNWYKDALLAKIALESAQATVAAKSAVYRNVLAGAKKAGVSIEALTHALKVRLMDKEEVLITEREKIKMLALSGYLPGIVDQLLARLDIQEPTANEQHENDVLVAYDAGAAAGRSGHAVDNPYEPGTLAYVKWADGWRSGQRAIADEMLPEDSAATEFDDDPPVILSNGALPEPPHPVA